MTAALQLSADDRAKLEAARAVIDRLLGIGPVSHEATAPEPAREEPKYMRLKDYCESRSISRRTLDRLIAQGFPTKGAGHLRRVVVAEADAWLERHCG